MNLTKIGKNIKSMREEANLTQAKVAEYLSVDEDEVVKIENGEIDIDLDIIQKLSNLYCCRLDQVLFGRNPKERIIDISDLDESSIGEMISLAAVNKIALNQFDMDQMLNKRG
jgi:transcriptional regulator with XRE-family HTH domain